VSRQRVRACLLLASILVAACSGGAGSATPGGPSQPPAGSTPPASAAASAAPSADAFEATWAELIAAAKAEGEIVFVGGAEGTFQDGGWYNDFGKRFGLKVTIVGGPTGDMTTRVFAEREQGIYSIDVASLGGTGQANFMEADIIDELDSSIFHPEALDRSSGWLVDEVIYTDANAVGKCQYVAIQADPNLITVWYNTEKLTQAEFDAIKSFDDLLDPKFTGRLVTSDIASGEAERDATVMWSQFGAAWYDKLYRDREADVVRYGGERDYSDGLARGSWTIGFFPPGSTSLQAAVDAGLPVKTWDKTMAEGTARRGIQRLCLVKDRPHPNAAKLFANWALTKEGQESFNQFTGRDDRTALRSDVAQGIVSDEVWNRARDESNPFVDDVNDAWLAKKAEFTTHIKALFAELGIVPGS
jgi:ABC-type Fe3+ transport system substrate-binding protein